MRIGVHTPSQARQHFAGSGEIRIKRVPLLRLKGFNEWKARALISFRTRLEPLGISDKVRQYFELCLSEDHYAYIICGPADVIVHKWPGSEPKILPLWNGILIQSDPYWLDSYPFLKRSPYSASITHMPSQREYNLQGVSLHEGHQTGAACTDRNIAATIISHNNHFGHFISDNLPLYAAIGRFLKAYCGVMPAKFPFRYRKGILEALDHYCPELKEVEYPNSMKLAQVIDDQLCGTTIMLRMPLVIDVLPSNVLTNSFLSSLLRGNKKLVSEVTEKDKVVSMGLKLFLSRQGEYSSRIANHKEIASVLESYGFLKIDPSSLPLDRLIYLFTAADIIVSECGSATLNACIFSPQRTRIVSLVPRRLIQDTDDAMTRSGIIYSLGFCDRTVFCMGETVEYSSVQSSDLVYYKIDDIINCLDPHVP